MSTMIKINEKYAKNNAAKKNDIYRKFSSIFSSFLSSEEEVRTKDMFHKRYVHDEEFEESVNEFRTSSENRIQFCIGYPGIGKSTSIRYCFGLEISGESYINTERRELIFPSFLDGFHNEESKGFCLFARIAAVSTMLEEQYPELRKYMQTEEGKREFYDFIRRHTGFALEHLDPIKAMKLSDSELILAKLESAYEQSPYEFHANKLKFYIKKLYGILERLIIVVDDIESFSEKFQEEIIFQYLKFFSCMKNTDYPSDGNYTINLLISIRPDTYHLLNPSQLKTFNINEEALMKKESVDLSAIFRKRMSIYMEAKERTAGNEETWRDCYNVVMALNDAFQGQYKYMIRNLCSMDIRRAFSAYVRVFSNRKWIQKDKPVMEYFTISKPEYTFNNINVIRALACGEDTVYREDSSKILPNIFYTTETEDLSICCLLVMQYFERIRDQKPYGVNAPELQKVRQEWSAVLKPDIVEQLSRSLEYLFKQRILKRSYLDFDPTERFEKNSRLRDDMNLYLAPRGTEILSMLTKDSVLLEMLRENAWRDYDHRQYSDLSSFELLRQGRQNVIFMDILEYIDYLCERQDDITWELSPISYYQLFGPNSPVDQMLKGVKNSLDYSGIINDPVIWNKYQEVLGKVRSVQK